MLYIEQYQHYHINDSEGSDILTAAFIIADVYLVCNETCHAGNKSPEAAEVRSDNECIAVIGEGRQKHGTGNVAYELRCDDCREDCVLCDDRGYGVIDDRYSPEIADEDEEE